MNISSFQKSTNILYILYTENETSNRLCLLKG